MNARSEQHVAGSRRTRTGLLRTVLAFGSVLLFGFGITSAAFTDDAHVLFAGSADVEKGIGHADQPAIWLSDCQGSSRYLQAPPADRDNWLCVLSNVPISSDPDATFVAEVTVAPQFRATYALDVTPTLSAPNPAAGTDEDPFPWLRFTITYSDGRVLANLTPEEFNARSDRQFTVCNDPDGYFGNERCHMNLKIAITHDPLMPYRFHDAKANIRMSFEAVTNPERPEAAS